MKTIKSYYQRWLDDEFDHEEMLGEIQKDAYNQALKDVLQNVKTKDIHFTGFNDKTQLYGEWSETYIDKSSIINLKKK